MGFRQKEHRSSSSLTRRLLERKPTAKLTDALPPPTRERLRWQSSAPPSPIPPPTGADTGAAVPRPDHHKRKLRRRASDDKMPGLRRKTPKGADKTDSSSKDATPSSSDRPPHAQRTKAHAHRVPVVSLSTPEGSPKPGGAVGPCSPTGEECSPKPFGMRFAFGKTRNQDLYRKRFSIAPEAFSISHKWLAFGHQADFWFRDRFHMLLSLSFRSLVCCLVLAEFVWAVALAVLLAIVTRGNVEQCLGGFATEWSSYYYFTVETMFTLGFGTPRYPTCTAANVWVSFAVMLTNVLHGTLIGLVFTKFSSGGTRRFAVAFSPQLCGALTGDFMTEDDYEVMCELSGSGPPNTSRCPAVTTPENEGRRQHFNLLFPCGIEDEGDEPCSASEDTGRAGSVQSSQASAPNPTTSQIGGIFGASATHNSEIKKYFQQTYTSSGIKRSAMASRSDNDAFYPTDSSRLTLRRSFDVHPRKGFQSAGVCRSARSNRSTTKQRKIKHVMAPTVKEGVTDNFWKSSNESASMDSVNPQPPNGTETKITSSPKDLRSFDDSGIGFCLSFRLMNLTDCSFFNPKVSIFLLCHEDRDLTITQILQYHTDIPLEFMEMPITVTVDSRDTDGPLRGIPISNLVEEGKHYELVVLLTFVDNQSSRTIELRKSWRLDNVVWGQSFKNIVRKSDQTFGAYQIDVEALDEKVELVDSLNRMFAPIAHSARKLSDGNDKIELLIQC